MKISLPHIRTKIVAAERISEDEGLWLYENAPLPELQEMAAIVRQRINGNSVFFNRNIHIEPTNICANHCVFCAFARHTDNENGAFALSISEIRTIAERHKNSGITEVHITGGVHPTWDVDYYQKIIATIREILPSVHIKAFTAEEVWKMHSSSGITIAETLHTMRDAGLGSLAGGGAEILVDDVRTKICPTKINSQQWLVVHETAHGMGIFSNATMLYGHVETYLHRIKHLVLLRELQDKNKGFNAFIPLKYKKLNDTIFAATETTIEDDSRNAAVCRIFLDNIPHIKAYLPALGGSTAVAMLRSGADDMDGTIYDGTKIYATKTTASPTGITIAELEELCAANNYILCERDSNYRTIAKK